MKKVFIALGLLLVLVTAQQGAVLHKLSHICRAASTELGIDADQAHPPCELCLAFAQVGTFLGPSHHVPLVHPSPPQLGPEPQYSVVATESPTPRSRGPPFARS